jgi:hypothetical protein
MLDFYTVYRVTMLDPKGDAMSTMVAVGIAPSKDGASLIWQVPGSQRGRRYTGEFAEESSDRSVFIAVVPNPKYNPMPIVFEVLTKERLDEMGPAHITGYAHLKEQLSSDKEVQNFYLTNFLPDYWRERYESDHRYK